MVNFSVPSSLQELERSPYNLFPYPSNFRDDDEATRADSFQKLVDFLVEGNMQLSLGVFQDAEAEYLSEERLQALYTLVRKSMSLSKTTRKNLIQVLCDTMQQFCALLSLADVTVPQAFREAFSCHLFMLYNLMFFMHSKDKDAETSVDCAKAILKSSESMAKFRNVLWERGVPDEEVINLPCRIAYVMLEKATGVNARKAVCGDEALKMIATTTNHYEESSLTSITVALMDLMHTHEHMAPLVAEVCTLVGEKLPIELLRETGRLDGDAKASGVKLVAPFIPELAQRLPKLVMQHFSAILPALQGEPYNIRSAIVTAIAHICQQVDDSEGTVDTSKTRNQLLVILADRVYDVSSFTRAAALKAWITLVQSSKLPKDRVHATTKLAMDRLQDKAVMVRKQSMQLLRSLLENNPYSGNLDPAPYRHKLQELFIDVMANMPETLREVHEAGLQDAEDEQTRNELEAAALQAVMDEVGEWLNDELSEDQRAYKNKVQALEFAQSALDFIALFEGAPLEGMLKSANTSDVTEALRFFVRARHFQLPCAVTGMKQALALMWASEQSIRDEVLKAFVDVFLTDAEGDLLSSQQITKNLLILVGHASVSELASIEEAIMRLVKDEKIPAEVFLILWSIASKSSSDARAAALQLLSMGASADRAIVDSKSRLKLLLEAGLGDFMQERRDWRLAGAAAVALQRIDRSKPDPSDAKFLVLERVMEELCAVASGQLCVDDQAEDTLTWFSAAEESIKALFVISPEPEYLCSLILQRMYQSTFAAEDNMCHPLRLARFFHVLGHIALNLLVYTEALTGKVRRATAKKSLQKQEQADQAKRDRMGAESEEEDAIEAELGVAAEAEAENERKLADISENEILGRGLIQAFTPLLIRVVGNEGGQFDHPVLMQSATLALCKCMSVSSSFCEKHLSLLFTALANVPDDDTTMRANTVVALGDLAFRFPNEVEPYTPRLYACLRDASTKVRRHTLMVLTHLILNDMVKVKGQVCEVAMCLKDDDPRIRDMSKLLFHELSKRSNNPIYNLLPDIISQLSQLSAPKDDFRSIMSFLLGFIKKEKQNEMLAEKLCHRYPKSTTMNQKADLTYCISQLKLNEKSVKILADNFKLYKDALFDEDIRKSFSTILSKAKKIAKPDMKQLLDEWEVKLNDSAALSAENEAADAKAAKAKTRALRRAARKRDRQVKALDVINEDSGDDMEAEAADFKNESLDKENAAGLPSSLGKSAEASPSRLSKGSLVAG